MKRFSKLAAVIFSAALVFAGLAGCSRDGGDTPVTYFGTKLPSEEKAVGDIVFKDGSATPYTEELTLTEAQKNAAIAIIFYKGTELNSGTNTTTSRTLGVGLKQSTGNFWCKKTANAHNKEITTVRCVPSGKDGALTFTGDKNGSDNLEQISIFLKAADDVIDDTATEENYSAFYFGKNYADQDGSRVRGTRYKNGWYLPSIAELFQIWKSKDTLDAASALCGGDKFDGEGEYYYYLSSSQYNSVANNAYILNFKEGSDGGTDKLMKLYMCCAVRDFDYIGTKARSEAKEVGDIVFNDGSATPYKDGLSLTEAQQEAAIAIIFYKGTELNNGIDTTVRTLGVGLKHTGGRWCAENANAFSEAITRIQCTVNGTAGEYTFISDKNGSDNLEQISAYFTAMDIEDDTGTTANYPAFYFGKNYADQDGSRVNGTDYAAGWYLPSIAELFQIWKSKDTVDAASKLCSGDKFDGNAYWSSSQGNKKNQAHRLIFKSGQYESTTKYGSNYVCAVREF